MPAHDVGIEKEPHQIASCFVHQHLKDQPDSQLIQSSSNKEASCNEKGLLHSRLLTKTQLADMTLGVRELSKQLGNVRLKLKVKTIFLLVKAHDDSLMALTRELVDWLLSHERDRPYLV